DPADRLRRSAGSADSAPELAPELVTTASSRRAPRLVNHGRVTRAASVSMAAVAAVAVGSLVIANPFAPQSPLFTAASGGAPSGAQSSALAEDARIAIWVNYEYLAGPGISTETGRGNVYQLQRVGTPEQVLREVAGELGVDGEVAESEYFDPAYPTYVVGPEDGSAPSVSITWSGTGTWWFSNPAAYPPPVCETVVSEDENGERFEYDDCVYPETAAADSLAPSDAEARSLAADLFRSTGLDVAAADIRITADEWQTMAAASLTVDGVATAVEYAMAWTPTGEIAWATGHAINVVDRGEFDTVSAATAVDRLSDWRWFGAAGPDYQGGMSILAAESGVTRDAGAPVGAPDTSVSSPVDEPGVTEPGPAEPGTPEPGEPGTSEPGDPGTDPVEPVDPGTDPVEPVDPGTEPEPLPTIEPETITVTVDEAETTLLLMWDSDGNAWLVPGFAMPHPDGWFNTIVSLIEGVIEL
ncbi:MAG: hypothetical protein Q7J04_06160, partial [Microcella sp.]|nr:hypothetical protein [Microcella sp.]